MDLSHAELIVETIKARDFFRSTQTYDANRRLGLLT